MLILVRTIRMRGERIVDQRDAELNTKTLRIGSGEGQDIQLSADGIATQHAVIQPQPKSRLLIRCKRGTRLILNDQPLRRATLKSGDSAWIGPHRITPLEAPPGFDAAVEVCVDADATQSIQNRLRGALSLRLPRPRFYSYILLLLVVGFGLAIPMLGFYHPNIGTSVADTGGPTDQLWSTGALSNAHHIPGIANNCNVCHVKAFQKVRNNTCLNCHDQTTAHLPANHPQIQGFDNRCTSCHKEHNNPPTLVMRRDALCTDCHKQGRKRLVSEEPDVDGLPVTSAPQKIPPTTGFSVKNHPQFLAAVLRGSGNNWHIRRVRLGAPGAHSSSHLKFSHKQHLNPRKVQDSDAPGKKGRALHCNDCHKLKKDKKHFKPITMENTCRACHTLAFDDAQPNRQLPHGNLKALRTYLLEFYTWQAALAQRNGPSPLPRAVPDWQTKPRCKGNPLDCGAAQAKAEMNKLFTKKGCVECHAVYRKNNKWHVRPVRLVSNWFPDARFNHKPHLTASKKAARQHVMPSGHPDIKATDSTDATCEDCHKAETSTHSRDILMPGIATCAECHGDNHPDTVKMQCVDCHRFHRPGMPMMGKEND